MKKDKIWIKVGLVLLIGAVTRRTLNSLGGIKSFPYVMQIIIMVLIPIIIFVVIRKERKKMNKFQYRLSKLFIIFFTIIYSIITVVIVLNNSFPVIWKQYRTVFIFLTLSVLLYFSIYIAILTLRNIKK